jgi:hypothetical protein
MNKQFSLRAIIMMALVSIIIGIGIIPILLQQQSTYAHIHVNPRSENAPIATSGDNIYITWSTNKTGTNDEVMFRASTDGGKAFGDKINLSNTTKADSQDAQIDTFGDNGSNVIVTWWERNATSNEPVARISTDNGKTFGPLLKLAANGTIGSS